MGPITSICVLLAVALISYSGAQTIREISISDMDQITSRLKEMGLNTKMELMGGTVKSIKNLVQYQGKVTIEHRKCVVTVVTDDQGNTIKTVKHCTGDGPTYEEPENNMISVILSLIKKCKKLHKKLRGKSGDQQDYSTTVAMLEMILQDYRTNGKFDLNDRKILKFNMFCRYRYIIQELLERIRLEFVTNDQQVQLKNIDFLLQIQQLVNMLATQQQVSSESQDHTSITTIIARLMDAYYNNQPLGTFKHDLSGITDPRYQNIIRPLITIIIVNPPPVSSDPPPVGEQTDRFEIALRQLIMELQMRFSNNQGNAEIMLLKYFKSVLNVYLGNLYVLPSFRNLPKIEDLNFPLAEYTDIITKFFLLLQQQYNKQHFVEDTSKCIRLNEVFELLAKFLQLLELQDGQKSEEYEKVSGIVLLIIRGVASTKKSSLMTKLDRLSQILMILVKLQELRMQGGSNGGFSRIFLIITNILTAISRDGGFSQIRIESDESDLDDYKTIIIELDKFLKQFNPRNKPKKDDEFVIKIRIIIQHLKENRKGGPDEIYDRLLIILNRLINDYRKNKMLPIYTIEELYFDKVYLRYIDIFEEIIKNMQLQYVKQSQHNEVTKLIVILQIHKLLLEVNSKLSTNNQGDYSEIIKILIQIMKDVGDKGQMQKDYIDIILKLKDRNDQLEKLVIELIKMITNMPSEVQPLRPDEDYFVKEIRQLIILLQKLHDEGKSDEGYVETLTLLQFILTSYKEHANKLTSFSMDELKFHIIFTEYADIVSQLIGLLEKKHVDQNENDELVRLIFVSKIREFIIKLQILGEGNNNLGKKELHEIKKTLIAIMFALYDNQELDRKYMRIFEKWMNEFRNYDDYKNLIKEIIAYLKTCPRVDDHGDKPRSGTAELIIVLITKIEEGHERGKFDDDYSKLIEFLQIILEMVKRSDGKLPTVKEMDIHIEIYLRSGLYNEILIELIRVLMSGFVARGQMEDVAILVKINNVLNWIVQLQITHSNVGADTGYQALIEAFIDMIIDLSKNGVLSKNYLVIWNEFLKVHVEYKNIILQVIEFLINNCGPCQEVPVTTTQKPNSGSGEVNMTDRFLFELEIIVKMLQEYEYSNKDIIKLIHILIEKYENNERRLPQLKFKFVKLLLSIKDFDEVVKKLINIIIDQYTTQGDSNLGIKFRYLLKIHIYYMAIFKFKESRYREEVIGILIEIIKCIWNEKKLEESIINQLRELQGKKLIFYQLIVEITIYLKTLPANLWVVEVRDDFITSTNAVIAMLKALLKSGGPKKLFKSQIRAIIELQKMYENHDNSLAVGIKIHFGDMYMVTLHFSTPWRLMIEAIMTQLRRQGEMEEAKRYEFILQIQWYLKLIVDKASQINPSTFKQLVALIEQILQDFNNRRLPGNLTNELFYYLQFSSITAEISKMIFYLSNWNPSLKWIGGTIEWSARYENIQWQLQQFQRTYVMQPYVIKNVYSIWSGYVGCATGCYYS